MNTAEICGAAGRTLEQVVDESKTVRCVRKPDQQQCFLKVRTRENSTLVVEADGQTFTHPLLNRTDRIALSALTPRKSRSLLSRMNALVNTTGKPNHEPSEFTVFIRSGTAEGALLATYSFKLMSETEFDKVFGMYARRVEPRPEPGQFTTDESAPGSVRTCWSCNKPISGECCEKCGCEQRDDHDH